MKFLTAYSCTKTRRPETLLEACLFLTGATGGTIHEYLPLLEWKYSGRMKGDSVWHLSMRGAPDDFCIGWCTGKKADLPKIEPHMPTYVLYPLPLNPQGMKYVTTHMTAMSDGTYHHT